MFQRKHDPDSDHPRPVIIKPVGRIFKISYWNPTRGKRGKCRRSKSQRAIERKRGMGGKCGHKNAENATDWNVTAFR